MRHAFSGSGPGMQTRDGCSVDFYRQLPYLGELADVEPELIHRANALELGCGTGRLCRRMLELGLKVAGVDESAEMLAHMPAQAERIHASIEGLNLSRKWSTVLLPSHMVNHPEPETRRAFVEAAHRHLEPNGMFYVRRHHEGWLRSVDDGPLGESPAGLAMFSENVHRQGELTAMTLRYRLGDQEWTQTFSAAALSEGEIEGLLLGSGFARVRWFGRNRLWAGAAAGDA